jgi:hypothetical protein
VSLCSGDAMPFDGSNYNPGPQRQPINSALAAINSAVGAFLSVTNLPTDTPCKVTRLSDGEFAIMVDREAAAENASIIAARRQAGA